MWRVINEYRSGSKNCWESHCNKGLFSIELPYGIRPNQEDYGTTRSFSLPTNSQSEVIADVLPTPGNEGAVGGDTSVRWCIACFYGRRQGRMMLLVHWVGQQSDVREHVLPVFASIVSVLSEQASLVE
jgi:hypothetical protein